MSIANVVNLMLSSSRLNRCTSKEALSRSGECAAHPHLCSVCWVSLRAHLASPRVAFESAAQRDALLLAGDRFVADLAALEAAVELHAAPDFAWLQVHGDQASAAANKPAPQPQQSPQQQQPQSVVDMPLFSNCAACGKALARGVVINAMGKSFHSACFACRQCGKALHDDETAFFDDGAGFPWCGCVAAVASE